MHADAFAETCTCRQHQLKIAFQPAGRGRANHVIALAGRQGGKGGFMEKQETGNTGSNRNTPEPGRQFTVTQGYLKDHIYMGVQKRSGSRILKKDFLNVELYLWIELETDHPEEGVLAFKMPAWFPGACRLPEEALWAAARENMRGSRKAAMRNAFASTHGGGLPPAPQAGPACTSFYPCCFRYGAPAGAGEPRRE